MININKKTAMNKFKFSDIATISTQKKKPTDEDKFHYIGLEHLDSKSLKVTRYGADVAPKGEKLVMKKGDVLFGKRRAYQKKVAIAPFDGIFSAHGMILRPNEKVISRELFPFFISSDAFLDKAIKISVGSLSPTINNSDIKKLEFELPDIREQEKYSNALFAINDTKEAYINLIGNLDKIQKSRFIEMFGDPNSNAKGYDKKPLRDLFALQMGKTPPRKEMKYWTDATNKWISISDMSTYDKYTTDTKEKIADCAISDTGIKVVPKNTVIMSFKLSIGKTAITSEDIYTNEAIMAFVKKNEKINNSFLGYALKMVDWTSTSSNAVKGVTLNKEIIGNKDFFIPPIELQNEFEKFSNQVDKSKFNLKCAITELDNLSDKIKSEIFS